MESKNLDLKKPLLSIVIPTYNRGARARTLVDYLLPSIEKAAGKIEIIVSNNCSRDRTAEYFESITSKYLRFIDRKTFLPTAEEHIFECLDSVKGDYVWFHGDDDIPNLATVADLTGLLETGKHDFLIFNSVFMDINGGLSGGWLASTNAHELTLDFVEGACALGLTSSFAGISNAVQRVDCLKSCSWKNILAHTTVYSHVAWWLLAFRGKKLTIVNRPIVMYRVDDDSNIHEHFMEHAKSTNTADYFFWTTGLVRLYEYLEEEGILAARQVANLFEFRRDGSAFRFLDNVAHMCRLQVISSLNGQEKRNTWEITDFERVVRWLLRLDPGYFECLSVVRDMFYLEPTADQEKWLYKPSRYMKEIQKNAPDANLRDELNKVFDILLNHKTAHNNRLIGIYGRYRSYTIYNHLRGYIAFNDSKSQDVQAKLRVLDPITMDDTAITSPNIAELYAEIDRFEARRADQIAVANQQAFLANLANDVSTRLCSAISNGLRSEQGAMEQRGNSKLRAEQFIARVKASLAEDNRRSPRRRKSGNGLGPFDLRRLGKGRRRELAGFDRDFYLFENKDVAASGLDPLEHFLTVGWKEGRDPSPFFSMKGYCAYNEDVVAARVNPYLHFLEFGIKEQRNGWQQK